MLDSVRTDCTGGRGLDDPKACLPPLGAALTQAQLLTEIYLQRRYELFGTGLRWEDSRRRNAIRGPVPRRPFRWTDSGAGSRTPSATATRIRTCRRIPRSRRHSPLAVQRPETETMNIQHKALGLGTVLFLAFAGACGTSDAPTAIVGGDQGRVRFVNLITDPARNPVDAILEGLPFGVNLGYTATTPATLPAPATALYSPILVGDDRELVVVRTAAPATTLATILFDVTEDVDQTIYAIGGTAGAGVGHFITTDDNTPAAANQVRMRVINATAGAVDAFVTASGADLTPLTPNAANLPITGSASAYFTVAPGTYVVRFVPAGTAPASRNASVTITVPATAFAGGTGRTIVAAENAAGTGAQRGFILSDR